MDQTANRFLSVLFIMFLSISPCYGEMYKWVDEKGTLHFADDLSKVPEKYRHEAEIRKAPKEIKEVLKPETQEKPKAASEMTSPPKTVETQGYEVNLFRRHELWLTEVVLNGRTKQYFIVDTGASFTLISRQIANELGIPINDQTPFIRVTSVSDVILTPLVTLRSIQVGKAEVENVEALVYTMPSYQGLLGNSFLNKFKVVIDSLNGKMTLFSMQGIPSPDRPGGYMKEYWIGQFKFYHRNLEELRRLKANYESRGSQTELTRINNAIRYFEGQLNELERRASFAGVPRNWRE
jgi:clan AA aspartic protease (TIGR02281 family)